MSDDRSMVYEFVSEAKEHLANVGDDLLALEQGKPEGVRYRLDRLFRAVHSVKGGAGFLGFSTLAGLTHCLESALDQLRRREEPPRPAELDALMAGCDLAAALLDDVEHSNAADTSAARATLARLFGDAPELPRALVPAKRNPLVEELRTAFAGRDAGGRNVYLLSADLAALYRGKGVTPVAFVRALAGAGEVLDARLEVPPADLAAPMPAGPVLYHAAFATGQAAGEVAALTGASVEVLNEAKRPPEASLTGPVADQPPNHPTTQPPADHHTAQTVRLNVELLDRLMTLAGELVLVRNQALLSVDQTDATVRRIVQRLNAVTSDLQEAVMLTRMQPVGNLFNKFPRMVRDVARQLGKEIELTVAGTEVELDKTILEALSDPLTHMVRNCCDHGVETPDDRRRSGKPAAGRVELRARHEGSQISITVRDDGRGIDPARVRAKVKALGLRTDAELNRLGERESLALILLPGVSTAKAVTDLSGRGVGMDVVKTNIDRLGGSLEIDSVPAVGTTFQLRLPLTVAIIPCMIVRSGGERYAIPQKDLEELVCLFPDHSRGRIETAYDQEVFRLRDRLLPIVRLNEVLARRKPFTAQSRAEILRKYRDAPPALVNFAVVRAGSNRFGLVVDEILSTEEVVVKPMQSTMRSLRCYSGATIMGDGRVALILDLDGVARHAAVAFDKAALALPAAPEDDGPRDLQSVLLFRSGPLEQFAVAVPMIRRIETVRPHQFERVGDREFVTVEGVSTLVVRLDKLLAVSPCPEQDPLFLLMPRNVHRPLGILMSGIIDTATLAADLSTEGYHEDGVLGTAQVRGRLTIVLDVFHLADRLDPQRARERERKREQATARGRPRVLLVDDTQFFRHLVKGYLEDDGLEVVTAVDGAKGLEAFDGGRFDLIVSDIEMPVMNGWEFARTVRRRPAGREVPLLALTTLSSQADRERAAACGFDEYEVKVDRESFLAAVGRLLAGRRQAG